MAMKLEISITGSAEFIAAHLEHLSALAHLKMWNAMEWNRAGGGGGWDGNPLSFAISLNNADERPTSYPFLALARKHGVDYGDVLYLAEYARGGLIPQDILARIPAALRSEIMSMEWPKTAAPIYKIGEGAK